MLIETTIAVLAATCLAVAMTSQIRAHRALQARAVGAWPKPEEILGVGPAFLDRYRDHGVLQRAAEAARAPWLSYALTAVGIVVALVEALATR